MTKKKEKNRERKRSSVLCAALPSLRFTPAGRQNPCATLRGLALHRSQAEDSLRTGNLFLFLLLLLLPLLSCLFCCCCCCFLQSSRSALADPVSLAAPQAESGGCAETLSRLFTRDFTTAADPFAAPPKQTRPRQARLNFLPVFFVLVFFFPIH